MTDARPCTAERALAARHGPRARGFVTLMLGVAAGTLLWAAGTAARATESDPPGRVGRIVELQGNVSRFDQEEGRWSDAERNRPLTTGDRLSTAGGARVELRVGSTILRLGGGTELELLRVDDERVAFQLHSGALALRVRAREQAAEIEVVTQEARLLPLRAGHYRFDRIDDTTYAASWRGDLRVDDPGRLTVASGQRLELHRDVRTRELRHVWRGMQDDAFAAWVLAEDPRDERTASARHVSPEMTGAEDLDRWGAWDRHPEYGTIWYPHQVSVGWTPYRYGRWVWVRPWGWTWVDEAPWGFAPFHYGRWVHWRNRWCWAPGTYVHRPVYAPALVAWVGGPNVSISVNIGGPHVGWVPLAPREHYVPYYRATPVYIDRINVNPRFQHPGQHPQPVRTGPVAYTNQGVPGAVTMVPRDVLVRREPVARAVVQVPEVHRAPATVAPPAPVAAVVPAPVGRVAPPRDAVADDGRAAHHAQDRGAGAGPRSDALRQEPPVVVTPPRQGGQGNQGNQGNQGGSATTPAPAAPGTVQTPGRRGDAPADAGSPRDRRERRDAGDGGDGRDARVVRPVQPAPTQATPAQPAPAQPPQQAAPPPRQGAAPVVAAPRAAAVQAAPVIRAPAPQPPRGERAGDDDRKRSTPARQGDREREANR